MSVVNVVLNKTVEINRFVHSALAIPARLDHPTNTIGTWTCAPPHVHIQPTWTWFPKDYIYCFFKVCSLQECKWYHIIDHEYYSVTTATCKHALHDLHGTIYHSTSASCKPRNHCCIISSPDNQVKPHCMRHLPQNTDNNLTGKQ